MASGGCSIGALGKIFGSRGTSVATDQSAQAATLIQSAWRGHQARDDLKLSVHWDGLDTPGPVTAVPPLSNRVFSDLPAIWMEKMFLKKIRQGTHLDQGKVVAGMTRIRGETVPIQSVTGDRSGMGRDPFSSFAACAPEIQSTFHAFALAAQHYPERPCLGFRSGSEYSWENYETIHGRALSIGSGLRNLGLKRGDLLGICSPARPEWLISDLGAASQSIVVVPMFDTVAPVDVLHILSHSEVSAVVSSSADKTRMLLNAKSPTLKVIIQMEPIASPEMSKAAKERVDLVSFEDVENAGLRNPCVERLPLRSDLSSIVYTPGTTAVPKGVLLSHGNLVASLLARQCQNKLERTDRMIAYLPTAHVFERALEYQVLMVGGAVGFFGGSLARLIDDMQLLRPTIMPGAPSIFERVYDRLQRGVRETGLLKRAWFQSAYQKKRLARSKGSTTRIYNHLIFKKMTLVLGGAVRCLLSGGGSVKAEIQEFLSVCLDCAFVQEYGLTETAGVGTMSLANDTRFGHIGAVHSFLEFKLCSVPELECAVDDTPSPRGTVCLRGPAVFQGYHKDDTLTQTVLARDGWLQTGDIAGQLPDFTITLVDRVQCMFRSETSVGCASSLEMTYRRSPLIDQVYVHSDPEGGPLVAVAVPKLDALSEALTDVGGVGGLVPDTPTGICEDPKARELVVADLNRLAKDEQPGSAVVLKAVQLEPVPFSVANGCLTPTQRVHRRNIAHRFSVQLQRMGKEAAAVDRINYRKNSLERVKSETRMSSINEQNVKNAYRSSLL